MATGLWILVASGTNFPSCNAFSLEDVCDCSSRLRSVLSFNDAEVGNDEMVVGLEDAGVIFERLGSGLGTSILSASDLVSKNGFLVL